MQILRSGVSRLSTTRLRSEFLMAKSKISSILDRIHEYQSERNELKKRLPAVVRSLQYILSAINFILFCIYVGLFGFTISSCLTAINEDCLKAQPSYDVIPERVVPNLVNGYKCTGIQLFDKNDFFQPILLVVLITAIGLQMVSSNLAFIGSVTLTTKNIKMYIWLFVLSTILLIIFFVFDFPLSMYL